MTPTDASTRSGPARRAAPAAATVAEQLTAQIIDRATLGSQLPSEAALATRFGVSRVTIREALKILAGQGLVSLSRGRRAMVEQPDGAMFGAFLKSLIKSDPRALLDLVQVRRTLEVQAVSLACRNASRAGLAAIEGALDSMRDLALAMPEEGLDPDIALAFDKADVQFHQALALAGGNRVLTYLFEAMETPLLEAFIVSHRGRRNTRAELLDSHAAHRAIQDHIRAGDPRAARDAMLALLDRAEANLQMSFGKA